MDISGQQIKNEQKPFTTPGAVSTREGISGSTQNIDNIIRSIPGGYTQADPSQGTISVNIRGMSGFGRVNTMVDGVPQTFYGTSETQGSWCHPLGDWCADNAGGRIQATSGFGATIDQNLLVGIDMQRGTFSGGNGNALMGSANLRTIGVNDVVMEGESYGVLARGSYGSNALGYSYMGAVSTKVKLEKGYIGLLAAYSGRKTSQDYKIGGSHNTISQSSNAAFDPINLTQKPKNQLLKLEFENGAHSILAQYRTYDNTLAGRNTQSQTSQISYRFKPNLPFIDFNILAARTNNEQIYGKNARVMSFPIGKLNGRTKNTALNLDVHNTIFLTFSPKTNFSSTLGVNFLNNNYTRYFDEFVRDEFGDIIYPPETPNGPIDMDYYFRFGFSPEGRQKLTTIYLDNELNYGIVGINVNANYLSYEISTDRKAPCEEANAYCSPKEAGFFSKKGNAFNISSMLSLSLDELFSPFVSLSRTHRIPTPQEMFYSATYADSDPSWPSLYQNINTNLKPESATTYQIGFNSFKRALFTPNDTFGFKLTYYHSQIDNYIYDNYIKYAQSSDSWILLPLNGKATFKGVELEASYDARIFFVRLNYTHQDTDRMRSATEANAHSSGPGGSLSTGQTPFSELPQDYGTLDAGARFFNAKLAIGTLIKYTGRAKRTGFNNILWGIPPTGDTTQDGQEMYQLNSEYLPRMPLLWDIYTTFSPTKYFDIKLEVQNLMDKRYVDPLYAFNATLYQGRGAGVMNNYARGRTYVASVMFRF
ncbi:TonB-dependent receptor domain-containing protein [Helicobacter jaachi]